MNPEQEELLSMYRDIAAALDSEGIKYYIMYGTAIGVVRHKGFIPWDDDIDIAVMERDLDRIDYTLSTKLDSKKYYYQRPLIDHPHVILKTENMVESLHDKSTPFIDLFVIAPYPKGKIRRKLCDAIIWGELIASNVMDRMHSIIVLQLFGWSVEFFRKMRTMIVEKDSTATTSIDYCFKKCIFDESIYDEPIWMPFEDTLVPLPREYDSMLSRVYGDYMTPPEEGKRSGARGYPCCAEQQFIIEERSK